MSGYSKTPLSKKIGFKPDYIWAAVNAFKDLEKLLAPLPEGIRKSEDLTGLDLLLWCCNDLSELEKSLPILMKSINTSGMIWVLWYKKASRKQRDVNEDVIRNTALGLGLVDVKVCAVNKDWSGLKLVYRLENR
ncbi:MAG: DUF3052 family protein [Saprospiraceae bacterium]|nr:DUF3052 family protein [Saprospiraceae bacterium]